MTLTRLKKFWMTLTRGACDSDSIKMTRTHHWRENRPTGNTGTGQAWW